MPLHHHLGYCTNVHAGATLDATCANLAEHAPDVKRAFSPDAPLGVGLWLSHAAVSELKTPGRLAEFRRWLEQSELIPFTLNGFPYGDFHQKVVKYDVYRPTWCDERRVAYTMALADIVDKLLPAGMEGSISTLPLCWGRPHPSHEALTLAAANLRRVVDQLARVEDRSGRLIYVCLEPEPGCVLQRSDDVVDFFEGYLFREAVDSRVRRYLRVCHDICHAAVMFENQSHVLARYREAGILVGKLQVSSALALPLHAIPPRLQADAMKQLASFTEDRYLHQTVLRTLETGQLSFFDDLPDALDGWERGNAGSSELRVHFHVPIYRESFDLLRSTRDEIQACWQTASQDPNLRHVEIETYAWGVLPSNVRQLRLADGIAEELRWFRDQILAPNEP